MAGKARVGNFSAPSGPYGGNIPIVRPSNNVLTPTVNPPQPDQAAVDANQAAIDALLAMLKQLQLGGH